jgi:DNA-binding MarR family transcriptional regulator
MARNKGDASDEQMGFPHLVKRVEMAVRARVERAMRDFPISSSQLFALVLLDERGEATAAELARLMHLTPQALTTLLKPLRDQDLIEREVDEAHRRKLIMRLTDAGRAVIVRARDLTPDVETAMLADFSAKERETLLRLLARVARPLD